MSHWTSFSFKTFVSDESIHGKPDTLDTFAPWNPRQSCIFGFHARGFRIPGTAVRIPIRLYMYSGIQSPGIPDSTAKCPGFRDQSTSENFPESGILIPYMGRILPRGCRPSDSTSGEPDSKQVAVISKQNSRFRFRFQNKRTSFDIMFRL